MCSKPQTDVTRSSRRRRCEDHRMRSADPQLAGLGDEARMLQPRTVAFRRALHRRPELGLDLPRTRDAVVAELADLPLQVHLGRSVSSVVAVLDGARAGPTVLLRGDMDALPLHEDTDLSFRSEVTGAMHACGHDTHVAMLASTARDRKSTRLNSSHANISYAVFCLKK